MDKGSYSESGDLIDFTVDPEEDGLRLDSLLAARIPGCSRTQAVRSIRHGLFRINNIIRKPGHRVSSGDRVSGIMPFEDAADFTPQPVAFDVLYSDAACIVINKPPGLVVHPAPGHAHGTLAHGLVFRFPELVSVGSSEGRPGIVHRLDKDTSGVLVVARSSGAYRDLLSQFKSRALQKTYLAFVYGDPAENCGRITLPIARHHVNRQKMAVRNEGQGRHADTQWRVLERFGGVCLMEFDIKTGRTHQIRVHSAAIGHPVIGDTTYGFRNPLRTFSLNPEIGRLIRRHAKRQLLHAAKIVLTHPETGEKMAFQAPLPDDMTCFLSSLKEAVGQPDETDPV